VDYERDQHPPPTPTQKASLKIFHATTQKTKKKNGSPIAKPVEKYIYGMLKGPLVIDPGRPKGPSTITLSPFFRVELFQSNFYGQPSFHGRAKRGTHVVRASSFDVQQRNF
jgi:hypothetical protein